MTQRLNTHCLTIGALMMGMAMIALPTAQAEPVIGKPAPAFTGIDSAGKTHRLRDYRGRRVVLEWTNHDCPFVGKHYRTGNMQATQKDATADGAVWLSVISSAPGTQGHVSGRQADQLTTSRGARPTAVLLDPDGTIGRLYDAVTTPHMYIIDGDGRLAYMGAIDSIRSWDDADVPKATNYVKQAMAQMRAGQPVKPRGTRPYGCSVKYAS